MPRHFLDLSDFSTAQLRAMLDAGHAIKKRRRTAAAAGDRPLDGKTVAMIFAQPSLRTRASFEVGIRELGGNPMMVTGAEIELGERETIADTARVFSRYVDAIMIRILDHGQLRELAEHATVPVINGLTKTSHPCQVMADIMTFEERVGDLKGRRVAWTGDTNNVLRSWIHAAGRFDFELSWRRRRNSLPLPRFCAGRRTMARSSRSQAGPRRRWRGGRGHHGLLGLDGRQGRQPPQPAAPLPGGRGADGARQAPAHLHALPARHARREVTDAVIDGPQSAVLDEAENRLHAQKGVLAWCFGQVQA